MIQGQILSVSRESAVQALIGTTLGAKGYPFLAAESIKVAITEVKKCQPSIVILDLDLSRGDSSGLVRELRKHTKAPLIVVGRRVYEIIQALEAGADDYLNRRFQGQELLARLRVAQRRLEWEQREHNNLFLNGGLRIDLSTGQTSVDEKEVHLTPIETRLLCLLAKNVGKVLTHDCILREVWGENTPCSDTPSLRVFMAALRKKVEIMPSQPKYIQTHVGIGYCMIPLAEMGV